MKTSTKLFCTTALIILGCFGGLRSQTMTGTIITQPCNNNGNLGVTVTGLSLPIKYTYYQNTGTLVVVHNNVNSFTDNLTGVAAYQAIWGNPNAWGVAATDGTNTAFGNFAFTPPFTDSVKVIPAACPAQCTLQATGFVGGTPPFNCVWLNTNTSMSYSANPAAVPNGQYQITITDGAGCKVTSINSGSFNLNVQNTSGITVTITGAAANCTNGTATVSAVGGSSPYTFLWSNSATTPTLAGLSQGALTCTVTDNIGCQKSAYHYVSQVVNINFNTTITNATCLQANGAVMSFVNGGTAPYSYLWSNMATTANISSLTAGSYIVQITDAVGCTRTGYAYVNSTTPIILTNSITPTSCTAPTGGATLAATGGAAPYTGVWYTFPSNTIGMSISGRPAGNYSFKVTDANGCIYRPALRISRLTLTCRARFMAARFCALKPQAH
jgi:hypothetical protein